MKLTGKIGLLGDVHSENILLENIISFYRSQGIIDIISTGDISDGLGDLEKTIQILVKNNVMCIQGNHDEWIVEETMRHLKVVQFLDDLSKESQDFLKSLPVTREFKSSLGTILLYHGVGDNNMTRLKPDDSQDDLALNKDFQNLVTNPNIDIGIGGHTHRRMVRKYNDKIFINAGTLNRLYHQGFCILDLDQKSIQFYDCQDNENFTLNSEESLELINISLW